MSAADIFERYGWWASLNHGGLLIAPSKLGEYFPGDLPPLARSLADRLRRDLVRLREGGEGTLGAFLDTVLEELLDLHKARWIKGSEVDKSWSRTAVTREVIRPRRVWLGPNGAVLPVFVADASLGGRDEMTVRLGVGRGRRAVSRVVEWLRKADQKIALLVGGRHLRLIHAGTDYDAFSEWDMDLWFQEGSPGPQVTAIRALLSREAIVPEVAGKPSRLLAAILATRQGQAELSTALGERVRLAVETLISESTPALERIDAPGPDQISRRDIYIAATRLIMRCVVILFAESREDNLLPRNNPIYEQSYGLGSLRGQLDRLAGGRAAERLRHSHFAWPRLLSLFALVYHGSGHEALPVTRYGGGLFTPGDSNSSDPVLRALGAFESTDNAPSDAAVHRILELLSRSPVKVRQGKASRWVEAPVDFSDLSSEYIGILYEGLLDFELRRAPADEAMVFLNLGDEPVLPISRLDQMLNEELAQLLAKLTKSVKKSAPDEEEAGEEAEEEAEVDAEAGTAAVGDASTVAEEEAGEEGQHAIREFIQTWAERAVKAAKLVKYPRNDADPRVREQFNQEVTAKGKALIRRSVMPGAWFLVRWGGTRKGSGTFYTRPQLARPIVRRALEPLVYESASETKDEVTGVVEGAPKTPKTPEKILELKVCDPAMGSGSFLISTLRYLTDALFESLHYHGRLEDKGDGVIPRLADGLPADHAWNEPLPVPREDPDFDKRLKARLKRHVVERCIYGVDLDPLAVELAKTALWVETMDPKLPFGFLDHKLKCGNALVGCWFDRFQDYPIMAWEREGGDKGHDRFVNHFRIVKDKKGREVKAPDGEVKKAGDKWTVAIKERREDVVKPELKRWLENQFRQTLFEFEILGKTAGAIHDDALAVFEKMHELPAHAAEERERIYREEILENPSIQRLRDAFDIWCALWFWPGDELDKAPGPMTFLAPDGAARDVVRRVRREVRFFHWELEFADVFARPGSGFNAIVGNPPWETLQPNSLEFFANVDPLYRTYGKQEAVQQQFRYFKSTDDIEVRWVNYGAQFKSIANWAENAGSPFESSADKNKKSTSDRSKNRAPLLDQWQTHRDFRHGYADPEHPFLYQGSGKPYTYKMFLEVSRTILGVGGHLGILVPSGIYTDNGSRELRELFLGRCVWTHLYAFQNERFVFRNIDHRFKMAVVHVRKGDKTSSIFTRFRLGPGDSPAEHEVEEDILDVLRYLVLPAEQIHLFSPSSRAILELRSPRDLQILQKIYGNGVLLGSDKEEAWGIRYQQGDFNMTSDSKLFPARPQWELKGYKANEYAHWLSGNWRPYNGPRSILDRPEDLVLSVDGKFAIDEITDVALPLEQGGMLHQFDYSQKGWVSGTGLRAMWRPIPWDEKRVEPQFLVGISDFCGSIGYAFKPSVRRIARNTDARMMIAGYVPMLPCGDVASILLPRKHELRPALVACLNSFACDEMVRGRCGGTHVDYHYIAEIPLPHPKPEHCRRLNPMAMSLAAAHIIFASEWLYFLTPATEPGVPAVPWRRLWAVTPYERLRLRSILDAVVAELYGLDINDFAWILRDCDHPIQNVCNKPFSRTLDPKGFWRVDKDKDPELRHTVLSLVAFHELKRIGLDAFLAQNDGEGWMLPEKLRLADYGLGHDDRAKEHQPVASRLGDRFLPWQLEQGVDESWEECRRHAETIERILGLGRAAETTPKAQPITGAPACTDTATTNGELAKEAAQLDRVVTTAGQGLLFGAEGAPKNLFGEIDEKGPRRKRRK